MQSQTAGNLGGHDLRVLAGSPEKPLSDDATERRRRVISALFVIHLFLPYVPGTRLRFDFVVGYLAVAVLPFLRVRLSRTEKAFFAFSSLAAAWSAIRILVSRSPTPFLDAMYFSNHNITLLSICVWMALFPFLRKMDYFIWPLCGVSLFANGVAALQWLFPDSPLHQIVFSLWGGYYDPGANIGLDAGSHAEFLLLYAHRYTGIFNGMHALGIFDFTVITVCVLRMAIPETLSRRQMRFLVLTAAFSFGGGMLAASKSFYFGLVVALGSLMFAGMFPIRRLLPMIGAMVAAAAWVLMKAPEDSTVTGYFGLFRDMNYQSGIFERYGEGGFLEETVKFILSRTEILFLGGGGDLEGVLIVDSAFLAHILLGGLPFFLLFFGAIFILMAQSITSLRSGNRWAVLGVAINCGFLAVGIGIPTYQLGRLTELGLLLSLAGLRAANRRGDLAEALTD